MFFLKFCQCCKFTGEKRKAEGEPEKEDGEGDKKEENATEDKKE